MPKKPTRSGRCCDAIGWTAFGLSELARRGEVIADAAEVQRVLDAVRTGVAPRV